MTRKLFQVVAYVPFSPSTDFLLPGEGYQVSKPHPKPEAEALMKKWKASVRDTDRLLKSDWSFRLEEVKAKKS